MPRPRNEIRRDKVLYAPVTEEEQREVQAGAGLQGIPLGEFVRRAALEAAQKLVKGISRKGKLPKSLPSQQ